MRQTVWKRVPRTEGDAQQLRCSKRGILKSVWRQGVLEQILWNMPVSFSFLKWSVLSIALTKIRYNKPKKIHLLLFPNSDFTACANGKGIGPIERAELILDSLTCHTALPWCSFRGFCCSNKQTAKGPLTGNPFSVAAVGVFATGLLSTHYQTSDTRLEHHISFPFPCFLKFIGCFRSKVGAEMKVNYSP